MVGFVSDITHGISPYPRDGKSFQVKDRCQCQAAFCTFQFEKVDDISIGEHGLTKMVSIFSRKWQKYEYSLHIYFTNRMEKQKSQCRKYGC